MENKGVLSEYSIKKEELDMPQEGTNGSGFKIEIESVLDEYPVKEEPDADNFQRNSLGTDKKLKNEFETNIYHKWDLIMNEAGQDTTESHNTDIKETIKDDNYVEVKLETDSHKEVNEDEPDFVSLEDFNETQDADYCIEKQPLEIANASRGDGSKSRKFKCKKCEYQTNYRNNFLRHMESHKDRSERKLFDCATCGRTFFTIRALEQHRVGHMDPKDQPTYDCDLCEYKTTYKASIKRHKLIHTKRIAEFKIKPDIYQCDKCSYQTEDNSCFRKHERTHKARSDRDLFKCATCGHTSLTRQHLKQHMLLHMDPKDRPTHDCDVCSYKTIYKSTMNRHKLRHAMQAKPKCGLQEETGKCTTCGSTYTRNIV